MKFKIVVKANANKTEIISIADYTTVKLSVKSPPTDGKANREIVRFFSKLFKITQADVKISFGKTSKYKTVEADVEQHIFYETLEPFF